MAVNEIIDEMLQVLDQAWAIPLSKGRCAVDIDRMHELLEELRVSLPPEIEQARQVLADRDLIISRAQSDSQQMLENAQERAKRLVSNNEVIKAAESKARDIMAKTTSTTNEMRRATTDYIDNNLKQTEDVLAKALHDVKSTRQALKNKLK